MSVEERVVKIQRDVEQHAKELVARDPRSRVHAELMSYGVRVVCRTGRLQNLRVLKGLHLT